ncbi:MAG: hypothetical protein ACJ715_09560 [Ornithinibacter sp.]
MPPAPVTVGPRTAAGRPTGGVRAPALERTPVLDVVSESSRAVALYERHGWRVVGRAVPRGCPLTASRCC